MSGRLAERRRRRDAAAPRGTLDEDEDRDRECGASEERHDRQRPVREEERQRHVDREAGQEDALDERDRAPRADHRRVEPDARDEDRDRRCAGHDDGRCDGGAERHREDGGLQRVRDEDRALEQQEDSDDLEATGSRLTRAHHRIYVAPRGHLSNYRSRGYRSYFSAVSPAGIVLSQLRSWTRPRTVSMSSCAARESRRSRRCAIPTVRVSAGRSIRMARSGPPGRTTRLGTIAAPTAAAVSARTPSISPPSTANVGANPAARHAASVAVRRS